MTRAADREVCAARLLAAIHTALADCRTCRGAYLLSGRADDTHSELMVLTLFAGMPVTACHEDQALYRAAVFDQPPPCAFNSSIALYEVLTEPRRTLSYANLRRRFPLRLMGPR